MLVKINAEIYVLASDVLSVEKITKTASAHYGKWFAMVKQEHGSTGYEVPESEVKILVLDINRFLEK